MPRSPPFPYTTLFRSAQVLANYQADPQVVSAEVNKTRQSQAFPADPLYQNQWALPKISWDLVFGNVTPTGSAVVAVLDTGVRSEEHTSELQSLRHLVCLALPPFPTRRSSDLLKSWPTTRRIPRSSALK